VRSQERGLKTLSEKIVEVGLPAKGYLDYAWLQTNYYKERPQVLPERRRKKDGNTL